MLARLDRCAIDVKSTIDLPHRHRREHEAWHPGQFAASNIEPLTLLSEREGEIARLVSKGMSNKEVGQRLGISHWTVSTHLRRIFIKLEINRRIELCLLVSPASHA